MHRVHALDPFTYGGALIKDWPLNAKFFAWDGFTYEVVGIVPDHGENWIAAKVLDRPTIHFINMTDVFNERAFFESREDAVADLPKKESA